MNKKLFSAILSCFALSCGLVSAQTFNPRVEVENTYEGRLIEAGKTAIPMSVPDSLYQFQYQLDYSVFDNPYRGSYRFQPYQIEMKPDAVPSAARRLFVSLGGGWTLHPEADVVWSPVFRNVPLKLSVYDNFRGYWGRVGSLAYDNHILRNKTTHGIVFDNKAGANLRYEFGKVALEVDGGYRMFSSGDTLTSHNFHLVESEIRLLPLDPNKADYFYGGRIFVNAGEDKYWSMMSDRHKLGVNDMGADLRFGAPLGRFGRLLLDLGIESVVHSGVLEASVTNAWATPRYAFSWGSGFAEAGVKVSYLKGVDNTPDLQAFFRYKDGAVFSHRSDVLYPAVKVRQYLIPEHLAVYARATGGDRLNCYTDCVRSNPFFDPFVVVPNLNTSSDRIDAAVGFDGDVSGRLQFDVHGGYAVVHNGICDAVEFTTRLYRAPEGGWKAPYVTGYYNYCDYKRVYADASFLWKSPRLDIDGHFLFQDTDILKQDYLAVAPARFSGELKACYNWNRQAFAGVSLEAASRREGMAITGFYTSLYEAHYTQAATSVPGWVDLGLFGRYVINPRWTVWAKAGNLLGQNVQHYFLRPEKGPYGTLGISFNL